MGVVPLEVALLTNDGVAVPECLGSVSVAFEGVIVQGQSVTVTVSPFVAEYVCPLVVNVVSLLHTVVYSLTTVVFGTVVANAVVLMLPVSKILCPVVVPLL